MSLASPALQAVGSGITRLCRMSLHRNAVVPHQSGCAATVSQQHRTWRWQAAHNPSTCPQHCDRLQIG
ncbi:MAG: hypothetical protein A3H31_12670 [Gallionellales bacterium RIFCSPLOWO2_02_FULL_57_47]|nr:MAG: hypothetical protein A3H31_12670 [Gallionellales bacterium RIFCSPLOWO2_02_FULL_57_47]